MFGFIYDTWREICEMYFKLGDGSKKAYLQWFPFSKITKDDEVRISSEEFFNQYIKKAALVGLKDFLINVGAGVAAGIIQAKIQGLF